MNPLIKAAADAALSLIINITNEVIEARRVKRQTDSAPTTLEGKQ